MTGNTKSTSTLKANKGNIKVTDEQILLVHGKFDGHRGNMAEALGISERALYNRLARLKKAGKLAEGVLPTYPNGHVIKGVSTYIGEDGEVKGQWVKTGNTQDDRQERLLTAVREAFEQAPKVAKIKAPRRTAKALLAAYPMGDPHLGMYAWGEEAGDDFDLDIAEEQLVEAMRRLVECTPQAEVGLVVNLGDFFHADTSQNKTLRSGNILDVDTRWAKVLRTGVRAMRACIEAALAKHRRVHVINEIGNHDEHTSQMLTLALSLLYERNPRVTFDESPSRFHYYRFGKTFIGVTHGDTVKPQSLPGLMATDRPRDWGATTHRYWLTGHVHHQRVFEEPGCLIESFRTLAARDAWHSASGYRSGRDMQAIVFHEEYGEIERHRMDILRL